MRVTISLLTHENENLKIIDIELDVRKFKKKIICFETTKLFAVVGRRKVHLSNQNRAQKCIEGHAYYY